MGTYQSDKRTSRFYGLKLNRTNDSDIIEKLENTENKQEYIKSLIRNDMKKEEEKTMKRISIDNGATYISPEEAVRECDWETIVNMMDDETREAVHADGSETEAEFLAKYLEIADDDLIIG